MSSSLPARGLVLSLLLASPGLLAAEEPREYRGAQASARIVPSVVNLDLRDLPLAKEWQPGDPIKEIPRRSTHAPRREKAGAEPAEDALLQRQAEAIAAVDRTFSAPLLSFAGQGYTGVNPPDTVGDVGPNHYIQLINHFDGTSVTIYNKSGTVAAGPFLLGSLGAGGVCASGFGDPVVLYDALADRWLLSEFAGSGNNLCVYVSQTSDPVGGGWFRYVFATPNFPDYPKYAVWPDAYYVSSNENSPAVYALDRARMLQGLSATSQRFVAPSLAGFPFQALTPADLDGATPPPAGAKAIFMRHRDDEVHNPPGTAQDFVEIWEFHVDWATPANSTFTGPTNIAVAQFDSSLCGLSSFSCVPQPGTTTKLDPLREVVMFRLQYRNFTTHQALVGNFATDVNGADRAGIRWFELRKTGASWTLFQEGTYSPDAVNRWMGSAAMDGSGDIALGYSVSSSTTSPGIRYVGRVAGDPAGALPQGEAILKNGSASNGSNRWGDYAAMTVDPSDDCTFWFTTMYSPASLWSTWIGAFKFDSCGVPPTPDFTIAAAPPALTIARGSSGDSTITIHSVGSFTDPVTLSTSTLPAGVSAAFTTNPVTPPANGDGTSTLTLSASPTADLGTVTVTVNGSGSGLSHDASFSLTVVPVTAVFDGPLQAPKCGTVASVCDSGPSLLLGRGSLGPEPNQPNTIHDSCADGNEGVFHVKESIDRLAVSTLDASDFAPGKTVRIDATVWARPGFSSDSLDLYAAADAASPIWSFLATLKPTAAGAQTLSTTYTLPTGGSLQAIRARLRFKGNPAPCGAGTFDDHDDLVFAVGSGGPGPFTVTLISVGAQDGRILESNETSGVGGVVNSNSNGSGALRAGDDASDAQYRGVVSFDTSSIPDGATISAATLRLRRGTLSGTNPFSTHGACQVDAQSGGFAGSAALAAADFQAAATASNVGTLSNAAANGAWSETTLSAPGVAAINKTGTTQFRFQFTLDDNDDRADDYVGYFSGESPTPENRPQLVITYTNP